MRTLFGNYIIADWEKHKDIPRIDVKNLYPKTFDVQTYNPHLHKNPIFEQFKRDVQEKNMILNIEEIILECSHNEMPKYKFSGWCTENPEIPPRVAKSMLNSIYGAKGTHKATYVSHKVPKIKDVKFNGPAIIVFWADDTKTVVKCGEDDVFDPEKGIAMAIARKALGNKHNYFDVIEKYAKRYYKEKKEDVDDFGLAPFRPSEFSFEIPTTKINPEALNKLVFGTSEPNNVQITFEGIMKPVEKEPERVNSKDFIDIARYCEFRKPGYGRHGDNHTIIEDYCHHNDCLAGRGDYCGSRNCPIFNKKEGENNE